MKILHKYVLKEHAGPLLFSLATLTSLLLLNYVARQIGNLVGKGIPWSVIGEFFLLSLPFTIAMTFPMAVLVSTLYAFSRLGSENEVTGMKASGVSLTRLLVPVLIAAGITSLLMVAFNDQLLPRANHRLARLMSDIVQKKPTFALNEQRMNEVSPGRLFLQASRIDQATGRIWDVSIYDLSDNTVRRNIFADSGRIEMTADQSDLVLTLYDGESYELNRLNSAQLRHMYFTEQRSLVRGVGNELRRSQIENSYKSDRERTICDMQAELEAAEKDFHRARIAKEQTAAAAAAGDSTQRAATGGAITFHRPFRLGRGYCDLLQGVVALVSRAPRDSTELPADSAASAVPAPSTDVPATVSIPARETTTTPQLSQLPVGDKRGALSYGSNLRAVESGNIGGQAADMIMQETLRRMDQYGVEIHKKFALAAACIVFVLVGAPIALRFPRGGVGIVIGVSLVVFGLYYVGLIGGETLADRDIASPFLAMWAPNIILSIVGVVLLTRMGRESATTRGGDVREMLEGLRASAAGLLRFRRPRPAQ